MDKKYWIDSLKVSGIAKAMNLCHCGGGLGNNEYVFKKIDTASP